MPKFICLTTPLIVLTALTLASCSTTSVEQYEATALTSYTWQVKYANNLPQPRIESFATASVLNRNGLKPTGAVIGPDDQGLWWPTLPPRPNIDEVEKRKKPQEEAGKPELQKTVKYQITYGVGEVQKTLPTNYEVYRQVVKASPSRIPLELTFGLNDDSVEKAEPVSK